MRAALVSVLLVSIACVIACTGPTVPPSAKTGTESPPPVDREEPQEEETVPASLVTLAEFNKLEMGMTYDEAASVLGRDGEEMSRSAIADITTVMFSWENAASLANLAPGNMNATFQNGELMAKAQFGLPGPAVDPALDERLREAALESERNNAEAAEDASRHAQAELAERKRQAEQEAAKEKERRREPDAMGKFRAAEMYHSQGNKRMRDKRLKELLEEYPDTKGGRKAKEFKERIDLL